MAYNHDLWATSPAHQIANVFTEDLQKSGLFEKVEQRATEMPDMEFTGFLMAIEEVDNDSTDRYARVAIELAFRDVKKDSTLWKKVYDEKEPLEGSEPREIAKSASKLVNRYAEDAVQEIEKLLESMKAPDSEVQ